MSEEKKAKKKPQSNSLRFLLPTFFLVLIVALGYLFYPMFSANHGPTIILNTIELRLEQDTLTRSTLVTQTDQLVRRTNDRQLQGEWSLITECLPQGCDDAQFLNFIALTASHLDIKHNELLQNLIGSYKYWNSEDILTFSKAMTNVNLGVDELYSRSLEEKWNQIVECDGQCENENDLYFEIIEIVVTL